MIEKHPPPRLFNHPTKFNHPTNGNRLAVKWFEWPSVQTQIGFLSEIRWLTTLCHYLWEMMGVDWCYITLVERGPYLVLNCFSSILLVWLLLSEVIIIFSFFLFLFLNVALVLFWGSWLEELFVLHDPFSFFDLPKVWIDSSSLLTLSSLSVYFIICLYIDHSIFTRLSHNNNNLLNNSWKEITHWKCTKAILALWEAHLNRWSLIRVV